MTGRGWGLTPGMLDRVFPFHLVLDRDLTVRQVGSSLARLCPSVRPGRALQSVVEVVSPRGEVSFESLDARPRSLFVLQLRGGDLKLRGQMLRDEVRDAMTFVGSPWITDLATIGELGLTLEDFSVADNLVDYLLMLQTQGTALAQARAFAGELQQNAVELRQRAHALELLTTQLESVLNSAGEGIYGLDRHGTVTFANAAAGQLLRVDREHLVGRPVADLIRMEAADGSPVALPAPGEHTRLVNVRQRRADGSVFDCELTSAPIVEQGAVVGSVVVFRDTTERNAVDRMKGEFISMVSHELRTPLTSIRGALGLLDSGAAGDLGPRATRMVEVAALSSERLIRLVNDMLDVERMATGKLAVHPRPVAARELVDLAVAEMNGLSESHEVELRVGPVDGMVLADADRIVQTLNNLLGNAVKFSEPGDVVELRVTPEGDELRFDIRDTGPGIPPDQLDTIFEPFHQADSSDTRQKGGSGLGLAICRGLVTRHGGRIWATSRIGEGTTVSFTLPVADRDPATV